MENMDEARAAHLKIYVCVLAALATELCVSWIHWYGLEIDERLIIGTAIVACFSLLGDVFAVRVNERLAISVSAIALMIAIAALGPTWAALAAIPSALLAGRGDLLRTIYEVGHSVTTVYLAGMAFSFVSEPLLIDDSAASATVFYGTLVTGVVLVGVTGSAVIGLFRVKYGQPFQISWKEIMQPYLLADATNVLTAGIGGLALKTYGPWVGLVGVAGSSGRS